MRKIAGCLILCAMPAAADVTATFRDGAPTDRFTFELSEGCLSGPLTLRIDLSGSDAGLIFDTTGSGAGVAVFQPFVLVSGQDLFVGVAPISDGDHVAILTLRGLDAQVPLSFTIDLDDTVNQREITVSGAEIAGAWVSLTGAGTSYSARFGADGTAVMAIPEQRETCTPLS